MYYLELLYTPFLWCNSNKKEKENNGDMCVCFLNDV